MTPEDRVVCLCTRQHFAAVQEQALLAVGSEHTLDWDVVFETAVQHHVAPLVGRNLMGSAIAVPAHIQERFKKNRIRNIFVKKRSRAALEQILSFLAQRGIPLMLVKGEALNQVIYAEPWFTISGDIDIVLREKRADLDEREYLEIITFLESFNQQQAEFKQHIEYEFYEHHDVSMNNMLTVDWSLVWSESQAIRIGDYQALVMTREDMLLAAAINSGRKRYFWLKSLLDIATIISECPNLNWDLVSGKAHAYRCNTILYTALRVTEAVLGCELPARVLPSLEVGGSRARLIETIIKNIMQRVPLTDLAVAGENRTYKREFSWSLLLAYASYRPDLLLPKFKELVSSTFNQAPSQPR